MRQGFEVLFEPERDLWVAGKYRKPARTPKTY